MEKRSEIIGCGSYLPDTLVTNTDLTEKIDTTNEWIESRTGIRQRYLAADGELTSDLAFKAAEKALKHSGILAADVDMIILATTTPDNTFPATATTVQHLLGMNKGAAFDIQAVCSGFIYGLSVADNFIKSGQCENVLLIGAETFSRILDWEDRSTCVLFGDGAGAIMLSATEYDTGKDSNEKTSSILSTHLHSDGSTNELLYVDGGPSSTQTVGHVRMNGREVFRHAVNNFSSVVEEALNANELCPNDIDWVVPHQANKRILEGTRRKLNLPPEKIVITVDRHANTSAASIPLALDVAVQDDRIKKGDLVLMLAMGGGLTWGASLVRW
ncbi:MAG: beta-ketoacyl-ACP synthase III [Pseudomonadota bacterium]|nr:beta-ketoacyl-ACP synthase III [Pseudomonadota bacterium]